MTESTAIDQIGHANMNEQYTNRDGTISPNNDVLNGGSAFNVATFAACNEHLSGVVSGHKCFSKNNDIGIVVCYHGRGKTLRRIRRIE
jgi:hypothetical protein